jgi:DNA-binding transcriptional MerR regulator
MATGFQIGIVAERTGLTVDAIRFYERQRLVRRPLLSGGGFRIYVQEDIAELQFIRSAQALGFSLDEIRGLLSLRKGDPKPCARVERLLEGKLGSVSEKIAALKTMEADLRTALADCKRALRRRPAAVSSCPVLERIATESRRARRES